RAYRKAVELFQKVPTRQLDSQWERDPGEEVAGFVDLANFLVARNRLDDAALVAREGIRFFEKSPEDPGCRDALACSQRNLAEILAQKKQPQEATNVYQDAVQTYRQAIADWEKQVAERPAPESRDRLARSRQTLGEKLAQKKQPQEALKEFREAIAGWEKL